MILVNCAGLNTAYPLLEHASWEGCTLADLVFPFFIVLVGLSSVLSLSSALEKNKNKSFLLKKIMKRTLFLFFLGLCLNVFPTHYQLDTLRIMGVLQRIALVYFFSAAAFLFCTRRIHLFLIFIILCGYWVLLLSASPNPFAEHSNLVGFIDQALFSSKHLYHADFDPEGLLSTLPTIASGLLGNLLGFCLKSHDSDSVKVRWMLHQGALLMIMGFLWQLFFPLNKALWSSSYVLWTGGLAYLVYAFCFLSVELKQRRQWAYLLALFGKEALLIFILHVMVLKIQAVIDIYYHGQRMNLRLAATEALFGSFAPNNASLLYALLSVFFWFFFLITLNYWRAFRLKQVSNSIA